MCPGSAPSGSRLVDAVETQAQADQEFVGDGGGTVGHVLDIAAEEANRMPRRERAIDIGHVDTDQVHRDPAENGRARLADPAIAAIAEGAQQTVGIAGRDRRDAARRVGRSRDR